MESVKDLLRGVGNQCVGKFHQQIALVIDRVLGAVGRRVPNVSNREMKVAARVDSRNGPGDTLRYGYFAIDPLRVERELCVS